MIFDIRPILSQLHYLQFLIWKDETSITHKIFFNFLQHGSIGSHHRFETINNITSRSANFFEERSDLTIDLDLGYSTNTYYQISLNLIQEHQYWPKPSDNPCSLRQAASLSAYQAWKIKQKYVFCVGNSVEIFVLCRREKIFSERE